MNKNKYCFYRNVQLILRQTDELYASRENQAKLEAAIALRSEWNESLAKVAEKKKFVNDAKSKKEELKCAWKTSIMMRRAALQQFLQAEFSQYEQELVAQSKAFFVQRT
ncbi:hypothetical protein CAPTEDRAFT_190923 [Capitella teleta]|uniref:Uncharacterized protein n=1 Tax=Capitella teleta TaxID=283909 RepID=R7TD01_CAPTE|nr:hypothetical protein CAPTEDRAFT_190923 [Capitella teleta]|eukprot:ELT89362.1 hypothetical protein CAPTEDRAFT_190923 [Capitella teleta]